MSHIFIKFAHSNNEIAIYYIVTSKDSFNKDSSIKVSIVTTSYNSVATIKDTMESVLSQTYRNIEYIVKDGGSTDGTLELVKEYEPKFNGRMKWISEEDKGIYDGMNQGIAMATGDVIGIINSDDFFTSNDIIENVVNVMQGEKVDAVYGDIHFVRDSDLHKTIRYYSSKRFRPFWLRFGFMPAHPSFYVRNDIYKKAGLYKTDYQIAADFEIMVRLFLKYRISYRYINRDFVTMRAGGASTKSIHNRMIGLLEDVRACRENGIHTNRLFVASKYLYKILQFREIPKH